MRGYTFHGHVILKCVGTILKTSSSNRKTVVCKGKPNFLIFDPKNTSMYVLSEHNEKKKKKKKMMKFSIFASEKNTSVYCMDKFS